MEPAKKILRFLPILLFILLAFTYTFILAKPINLTTTDIGRHLINGREILSQNWQVLFQNTYSYTMPNQIFINHHWLSGVVFWLAYSVGGFLSLHIFHTVILLIFLLLFFIFLKEKSSWTISFLLNLLALLFFATRTEIRPESFGVLFLMIYLLIIQNIKKTGTISWKKIITLCFLQIVWINLHISFVFGLFVIGLFTLLEIGVIQSLSIKTRKKLFSLTSLLGFVSFLNPNTINGALSPFTIFQDYGYKVFENQNLWFLRSYYQGPIIPMFYIVSGIILLSFFIFSKNYLFEKALALTGIFLGWTALRNIPLFVIFSFPFLAIALQQSILYLKKNITLEQPRLTKLLTIIIPLTLLWLVLSTTQFFKKEKPGFVFGLFEEQQKTLDFLQKIPENAKVFNNYDIGSALVFSFFPSKKVFVDNRPEAYSSSFFQDNYIPLQNSESSWTEAEKKYQFTYIVFGHRDITPWAQTFMKNRLRDQSWKIIYLDRFIIVFIKDTPENKEYIEQHAIEVPLSRLKI